MLELIPAALNFVGGLLDRDAAEDNAAMNVNMQKEFAQQGIRWKVADAEAAGVHPLYALGAQTHSFSPVAVGGPSWSDIGRGMGQDLTRAVHATRTDAERKQAGMDALVAQIEAREAARASERRAEERHRVEVQGAELQNAILASQLAKLRAAPNPALPGGDGPSGPLADVAPRVGGGRAVAGSVARTDAVRVDPSKIISANPSRLDAEAGVTPGFKGYRIGTEEVYFPTSELAEVLESPLAALGLMGYRQFNLAMTGGQPPRMPPPEGHRWEWSIIRRRWVAAPLRRSGGGAPYPDVVNPYP